MPSPRFAGFTASRSRPSRRIAPPLGSTKPAIICKVVVLPQPDGPSRETNSPFSTPSERPSTAVCVPNVLVSPSSSRKAIFDTGLGVVDGIDARRGAAMQAIEGILRLIHRQDLDVRRAEEQPAQHAPDAAVGEHCNGPL